MTTTTSTYTKPAPVAPSLNLMFDPVSATWPEPSRSFVRQPEAHERLPRSLQATIASFPPHAGDEQDESVDVNLRATVARVTPRVGADGADNELSWRPVGAKVRLIPGAQILGTRYRIVRWLGEGGMGVVFEAMHVDLRRPVALKILKLGGSDIERDKQRFIAEAQAIAQVESPYVVDVLDFGELTDGRPFYTMELLSPDNLFDALQAGPLPLERALPILRQCCKALQATHAAGIAHRDIKPENVLLQREGGREDAVRLVDFGICASFESRPKVAGTAMYIAPEQIRGSDFDGRVDIYALGCMAMEMLTGAPPFEGSSSLALINAHLDEEPPSLRDRRPELSPKLDELVRRCLSKRPSDRYANMAELEAALCEVQIDSGILTPWDDITLPGLDAKAYESLARRMPKPLARRRSPNTMRRVQLAAVAFVIGVFSAIVGPLNTVEADAGAPAAAAFDTHVEELTREARRAGSQAYWAYPSESDPEAPTALESVIALERLEGSARPEATLRALELREEFARTLVRLGDRYWGHPQGELFASEFYAQALMFDPTHAHARERVGMSSAQIATLEARLGRGQHTAFDRELGSTLCVLSEDDDGRRRDRAEALLANRDSRPSSIRVVAGLAELAGVDEPKADVDSHASGVSDSHAPAEPEAAAELEVVEDASVSASSTTSSSGPAREQLERQRREKIRARARELTEDGAKALSLGRRDHALAMFQAALSHDHRHAPARAGLARVFFARGQYDKAFEAASEAATRSPRSAEIQLLLGDAALRSQHAEAARAAYVAAARLGSHKAKRRLAQLDDEDAG